MIISLILVLVAAALLCTFVFLAVRGQSVRILTFDDLSQHLTSVDLEAFRNLVDPEEEAFLRKSLPAKEFRSVQRERLHAAAEYVRCAARNGAVLLRAGEAASQSSDLSIAHAGKQLAESAMRLRLYALLSLVKISAAVAVPGLRLSPGEMAESYQKMSGGMVRLGRLQSPHRGARIAASL